MKLPLSGGNKLFSEEFSSSWCFYKQEFTFHPFVHFKHCFVLVISRGELLLRCWSVPSGAPGMRQLEDHPFPLAQLMGVSYLKTAYVLMLKMTRKMSPPAGTRSSSVVCLMQLHQSKFVTNNVFVYTLENREIHTESCDESPGCSLSQNMSTTCPGIPRTALFAMCSCDRNAAAPGRAASACHCCLALGQGCHDEVKKLGTEINKKKTWVMPVTLGFETNFVKLKWSEQENRCIFCKNKWGTRWWRFISNSIAFTSKKLVCKVCNCARSSRG